MRQKLAKKLRRAVGQPEKLEDRQYQHIVVKEIPYFDGKDIQTIKRRQVVLDPDSVRLKYRKAKKAYKDQ